MGFARLNLHFRKQSCRRLHTNNVPLRLVPGPQLPTPVSLTPTPQPHFVVISAMFAPCCGYALTSGYLAIDFSTPHDTQGEELLNGRAAGAGGPKAGRGSQPQRMSMCGLLSLQFYQPYFDVDTSEVKSRLFLAACPLRKTSSTFLGEGDSSQQADLYGPVWVRAKQTR